MPVLVAANPHATFARVAALLHPDPPLSPGVHAAATVAASAQIDASSEIAAGAHVGERVRIGARCFIGPGCVIGHDAVIGEDARFVARVFVGHHVILGRRCIVQPGAVIGGDGFGYAPEKGTWIKVPQLGSVTVGDDVEIGATTIDARPKTRSEEGVKLATSSGSRTTAIGAHSACGASAIAGAACSSELHHGWPRRPHRHSPC